MTIKKSDEKNRLFFPSPSSVFLVYDTFLPLCQNPLIFAYSEIILREYANMGKIKNSRECKNSRLFFYLASKIYLLSDSRKRR